MAALLCTLLVTPLVRRVGMARGWYDQPGDRKVHISAVPTLGGVGIWIGLVVGGVVAWFAGAPLPSLRALLGLTIGSIFVLLLGIADDIREVNWPTKIGVQVGAALVLVAFGYRIEVVANPLNGAIALGWFSVPTTVIWVLVLVNSINLIDGLDGLACGLSLLVAGTFFVTGLNLGSWTASSLALVLMGACVGFLPENFCPARIFMGDAGSTTLGFVLAAISLIGAGKSVALVVLAVPLVALGVPIADVGLAILRRASRGDSLFEADKEHIHHWLLHIGFTHRQVVVMLYGVTVLLGTLAYALSTADRRVIIAFLVVTVTTGVAGGRYVVRRRVKRSGVPDGGRRCGRERKRGRDRGCSG
jgi:UDP-GlcNAc:undecaprenyl-phosphate GlcNAc-1-phosphate transferase